MDQRIRTLRSLEPSNAGRASYLAILETAAGLFAQFPAQAITLRDILSISGVSNQTLYNYFPNGRDDIAIALYDRFQRTMVEDFKHTIRSMGLEGIQEESTLIAELSAVLARAVFGFLRESYALQSALFEYLRMHNLILVASHVDELEEALMGELALHRGAHFSKAELPRIVRVSVHTVRGIADSAMTNKDFSLDELESNARKMVRSLLRTGLQSQDGPSGSHESRPEATGPFAILGAPISSSKKQGIMDRLLKRKRRA